MLKENQLKELENEHCFLHDLDPNGFSYSVHGELVHFRYYHIHNAIELTCYLTSKSPSVIEKSTQLIEAIKYLILYKSTKRLLFLFGDTRVTSKIENKALNIFSDNAFYSFALFIILAFLCSSRFFFVLFQEYFWTSFSILFCLLFTGIVSMIIDFKNHIRFHLFFCALSSLGMSLILLFIFWISHRISLYIYISVLIPVFSYFIYNSYVVSRLKKRGWN